MIEIRVSLEEARAVWNLEVMQKQNGEFVRSEYVGISAYSVGEDVAAALRKLAKNVEERMT